MSTNDEILQVATHELIRQLIVVADAATKDQAKAAEIAVEALLALRDTVNRQDYPQAYGKRMTNIRKLCSSRQQRRK